VGDCGASQGVTAATISIGFAVKALGVFVVLGVVVIVIFVIDIVIIIIEVNVAVVGECALASSMCWVNCSGWTRGRVAKKAFIWAILHLILLQMAVKIDGLLLIMLTAGASIDMHWVLYAQCYLVISTMC